MKNIITLATGKPVYSELAVNLAYSFLWWNKGPDIHFYIITDQPGLLPKNLPQEISIIPVKKGDLGEGFSSKLFLDLLAPEGQTLFIDSDCLIFGDLSPVFRRFSGRTVSVIGDYISEGEWFGDVQAIREKYGVARYPKFNGGIYYLEKGDAATRIYDRAREIEKEYDEAGFVRLRGRPNDEVIMALAMELTGQTPVHDDGSVLSDLQACQGTYHLDVVKGERVLTNPAGHRHYQQWYPFEKVSPLIVHFLGQYTQHEPYLREVNKLRRIMAGKQQPFIAASIVWLTISLPLTIKRRIKSIFRRPYHLLFGHRKIKASPRI